MSQRHAIVIGAGLGGLSAAIRLATSGWAVTVFEAMGRPGGKAGFVELDGIRVDTGPSVLTMPDVFDELFSSAGEHRQDHVSWIEASPSFRYVWSDGAELVCHPRLEDTITGIRNTLGATAAGEFQAFMDYAGTIWNAAAPHFVYGPAVSWSRVLTMGPAKWKDLLQIDGLRSMESAVHRRVSSPYLRDVLLRYATYNGSDPRKAPATINCIAHVEMAMGGYGVKGGMYTLVEALEGLAKRKGVRFQYDASVRQIEVSRGVVTGVSIDDQLVSCDAVVANVEAAALYGPLLGRPLKRPKALSTSLWTGVFRAKKMTQSDHASAHTVFFPADYRQEFTSLFDKGQVTHQPSVYICDPCHAHGVSSWADSQPMFSMVNTTPVQRNRLPMMRSDWTRVRHHTESVLRGQGIIEGVDSLLWERTAEGLAEQFPGSYGALYGEASTNWRSAFKRPGTRVSGVRGLALASGSGHPGGGMPLATLSGALAAQELNAQFNQGRIQSVSSTKLVSMESNSMDQRKVS